MHTENGKCETRPRACRSRGTKRGSDSKLDRAKPGARRGVEHCSLILAQGTGGSAPASPGDCGVQMVTVIAGAEGECVPE